MTPTDVRLSLRGLGRADFRRLLTQLVAEFRKDDIPSLAAGVAFRIFLSLFPTLFAVVAAFTLVVSGDDIVALLETADFVPETVRQEIQDPLVRFVDRAGGAVTLTVVAGTLGGLWAASSAAVMLSRALTRIHGFTETRGFVALRLTGLVIAVAILVALAALLALLVAGGALQRWILATLALTAETEAVASMLMVVGRLLFAVVVLVATLAFVFWVGPDRAARPRFQWLQPGSLIAVVGWVALSWLFGLYARVAGDNEIYGALGGVIVLLLWLQLTMIALLVGAETNTLLRRHAVARAAREDDAGTGPGSSEVEGGERAAAEGGDGGRGTARRSSGSVAATRDPDGDGGRARAVPARLPISPGSPIGWASAP